MMNCKPALLGIMALAACTATATQGIQITVTPSVAPNIFGSPSWDGYLSNALYAIEHGLSVYGTAGDPTFFSAQTSPVSRGSVVVTGFNSWRGIANPGAPYGSELGNRMTFGLHIQGNGQKFSISELSINMHSTGDGGGLDWTWGIGTYNYGVGYVGLDYGADGIKGTGDDSIITSGPNTQLVDELIGRGSGNSYDAYATAGFTNQQVLDAVANDPTKQWNTFTGTYTLDLGGGNLYTGGGSFRATPEPFTTSLGFAAVGLFLRRRLKAKKS